MLPVNSVPNTEPNINIGIIMPEDKYKQINIVLPDSPSYVISFSKDSLECKKGQELNFKLENGKIHFLLNGEHIETTGSLKISPLDFPKKLHNKIGLQLKGAIAGRDFHWKKYIDVFLPGSVIIKIHDDQLIMINELHLEQYVMCVATSEMGAASPPALIESQTIVARSWVLANIEQKHHHLGMDACNDDCCQRYQGSTHLSNQSVDGALNTFGQVLLYDGKICDARYSKSCGGFMESFDSVWEGGSIPYMKAIIDAEISPEELEGSLSLDANFTKWIKSQPETFCSPKYIPENELKQYLGSVDDEGKYFRWEIAVSQKEITASINLHNPINAKAIKALIPLKRGESGRVILMEVHYINNKDEIKTLMLKSEYVIRQSLVKSFMYSSAIVVTPQNIIDGVPQKFQILGAGWGHGVGYCQIGALGMALNEYSTETIVLHYYPGSTLQTIYKL